MNILAFDTCFAACSAAAGYLPDPQSGAVPAICARFEAMATGHAERLVGMIGEVMSDARLAFDDLDRIAVTIGPGSFTGTRISVAAARALMLSRKIDVVPVSSLAVMAETAARRLVQQGVLAPLTTAPNSTNVQTPRAPITIAVDARRGEVYVQQFRTGGGDPLTEPLVLPIDEAAVLGGRDPMIVAGSAAAEVAAAARAAGRIASSHLTDLLPEAADLAFLAARLTPMHETLTPLYLRPADARPQTGKTIERAQI